MLQSDLQNGVSLVLMPDLQMTPASGYNAAATGHPCETQPSEKEHASPAQVCDDRACLCSNIENGVPERAALVCGDSLWQLKGTDCQHMCTDALVEAIPAGMAFCKQCC